MRMWVNVYITDHYYSWSKNTGHLNEKKKTVIHFTNVSHDLDEGKTLINNDKKNKSSKVTDVAIMQQEEEMLLKGH